MEGSLWSEQSWLFGSSEGRNVKHTKTPIFKVLKRGKESLKIIETSTGQRVVNSDIHRICRVGESPNIRYYIHSFLWYVMYFILRSASRLWFASPSVVQCALHTFYFHCRISQLHLIFSDRAGRMYVSSELLLPTK